MKNRVKEMLRAGKTALGSWISMVDTDAVWTVANAGFDWIIFDTEHGYLTIETLDRMIKFRRGHTLFLSSELFGTI